MIAPVQVKKAVLAKLPEENHDAWKALEHSMNKESIINEKKDKDVVPVPEGAPMIMMDKTIKSAPAMGMGMNPAVNM